MTSLQSVFVTIVYSSQKFLPGVKPQHYPSTIERLLHSLASCSSSLLLTRVVWG